MAAEDHELDYREESFADMCAREDKEEHRQEKQDQLRRVVKKIETTPTGRGMQTAIR